MGNALITRKGGGSLKVVNGVLKETLSGSDTILPNTFIEYDNTLYDAGETLFSTSNSINYYCRACIIDNNRIAITYYNTDVAKYCVRILIVNDDGTVSLGTALQLTYDYGAADVAYFKDNKIIITQCVKDMVYACVGLINDDNSITLGSLISQSSSNSMYSTCAGIACYPEDNIVYINCGNPILICEESNLTLTVKYSYSAYMSSSPFDIIVNPNNGRLISYIYTSSGKSWYMKSVILNADYTGIETTGSSFSFPSSCIHYRNNVNKIVTYLYDNYMAVAGGLGSNNDGYLCVSLFKMIDLIPTLINNIHPYGTTSNYTGVDTSICRINDKLFAVPHLPKSKNSGNTVVSIFSVNTDSGDIRLVDEIELAITSHYTTTYNDIVSLFNGIIFTIGQRDNSVRWQGIDYHNKVKKSSDIIDGVSLSKITSTNKGKAYFLA